MAESILIVEDSTLVTDAFAILFGESGYTVHSARTVADAIAVGRRQHIDLMVLDLSLPDGSGLDVLDALRRAEKLPRVTLAMTGHTDDDTRRDCMAAGCADVLVKPVPIRNLLRQIERLLA
ncbi:MAG TPA: response regulator [Gemmatimonadaceae bacterium]|nr:response regulator [Gemmatimonadaceae bacterium]